MRQPRKGLLAALKPMIIAISTQQQGRAHLPPLVMYRLVQANQAMTNLSSLLQISTLSFHLFLKLLPVYFQKNSIITWHCTERRALKFLINYGFQTNTVISRTNATKSTHLKQEKHILSLVR